MEAKLRWICSSCFQCKSLFKHDLQDGKHNAFLKARLEFSSTCKS